LAEAPYPECGPIWHPLAFRKHLVPSSPRPEQGRGVCSPTPMSPNVPKCHLSCNVFSKILINVSLPSTAPIPAAFAHPAATAALPFTFALRRPHLPSVPPCLDAFVTSPTSRVQLQGRRCARREVVSSLAFIVPISAPLARAAQAATLSLVQLR